MQRIAFRLWVQPERLDEYKRLHQHVWPDLLADMRAAGIRNYSIFADGPELFGVSDPIMLAVVIDQLRRGEES
jgi:L-rhamnose mutarotase